MIFVETDDPDLLTAEEIDRAFEVATNWGGWSFEEAQLMARALIQTGANPIVRVRADQNQERDPAKERPAATDTPFDKPKMQQIGESLPASERPDGADLLREIRDDGHNQESSRDVQG